MVQPNPAATIAEKRRDLRAQVSGLSREDQQEIIFQEISPRRQKVRLYSMLTGEPIDIPEYMVDATIQKQLPPEQGGGFMFTSDPAIAPTWKPGTFKCFLHRDSPERAIVEELGMGDKFCIAAQLKTKHSKEIHAQHRHKQEWGAYQSFLQEQKDEVSERRAQQQLDATLALAEAAAVGRTHDVVECDQCDFKGTKKQLAGHRMGAHK